MTQALLAWGPAAAWAAVLFLLSEARVDSGSSWLLVNDKVAHLGLYLVLGGTLAWAQIRGGRGNAALLVAVGILYGALDEWHQSFVPGRDPSAWDWGADVAGVVLGFFVFRYFLRRSTSAPGDNTNQQR